MTAAYHRVTCADTREPFSVLLRPAIGVSPVRLLPVRLSRSAGCVLSARRGQPGKLPMAPGIRCRTGFL